MATFKFITTFSEITLDQNDNIVVDYETNLPHHDIISRAAEKSWNDLHMERFYDGILTDKIESATMKCRRSGSGATEAVISIKAKPGVRLISKYRDAIVDQTSAQLSDGWGESFFGFVNIMSDGNERFCVE